MLHIIDASDELRLENIEAVDSVLSEIGADEVPQIQIMNKIDRMEMEPRIERDDLNRVTRIWVSAKTGAGMDMVRDVLAEYFRDDMVKGEISLKPEQARIRALLYGLGAVTSESVDDEGNTWLMMSVARRDLMQLVSRENIPVDVVIPQTKGKSLARAV